jgi:hypothetical protein
MESGKLSLFKDLNRGVFSQVERTFFFLLFMESI